MKQKKKKMFNRLVIIGAGGHGKVIVDMAIKKGYTDIVFVDDNVDGTCIGYPIIAKSEKIEDFNDGKTDFAIAIGDNQVRKKIAEKYNVKWVSLIHPSAQVGINVKIGEGTVIMAGAIVNSCTSIGKHCIINSCAVVEHDNVIEDYVHISPNVALGGMVRVGECTHIGIGASVKNNISICGNSIIGVGTTVVKNILQQGVYMGVAAKLYK